MGTLGQCLERAFDMFAVSSAGAMTAAELGLLMVACSPAARARGIQGRCWRCWRRAHNVTALSTTVIASSNFQDFVAIAGVPVV